MEKCLRFVEHIGCLVIPIIGFAEIYSEGWTHWGWAVFGSLLLVIDLRILWREKASRRDKECLK